MPEAKLFLYDPGSATRDVISLFRRKNYEVRPLSDDPQVFWNGLQSVMQNGNLVLMSHGDAKGPLLIAGQVGGNLTRAEIRTLTTRLQQRSIFFYCLSCKTGSGAFARSLAAAGNFHWVAPLGNAAVRADSASVAFFSRDARGRAVDWAGPMKPRRIGMQLDID